MPRSKGCKIHRIIQRLVLCVHPEDRLTAFDIRTADRDLPVETAWTEQCRVEDIRSVRCCNHDDAFVLTEAIHFNEQLVQCLFTFVMTAADACTTLASHCIDFIDEDDAWCVLLGILEQVTYTGCTDPDEHFYEVGTTDGEERHACFSGHRFCNQCLTCTRRADEQHTFRDLRTDAVETAWILQEVHHFDEFLLFFICARNILEADLLLALIIELRFALAEVHYAAATATAALRLTHQEQEEEEDQEQRNERKQHACPRALLFSRFNCKVHFYITGIQFFKEFSILEFLLKC